MVAMLLTGCATKNTYGTMIDPCLIFEMGYGSEKDTVKTLLWLENHNDIYSHFCLGD